VRIALNAATIFIVSSLAAQAQSPNFPFAQLLHAYVTGYNTVPEQTSPTPCIAASGGNICGRTDVVACPRSISLGSFLQIRGATYICEDRLAKKYDSRFDISCDKDTNCPSQVTGWVDIKVFAQDPCRLPVTPPQQVTEIRPLVRFATAMSRTGFNIAKPLTVLRGRFHQSRRA
jgi:hypothetical protein